MAQINRPTDYFNTVLYTGNNTTNAITTGFQPDLVWLKPRNLADHHRLMNSVSGADYYLSSNQTLVESATGTNFASFDSDGFTLGGSDNGWNNSSYNYASWNWLAGGTASSNTDGTITSQVSANTTSGFSIVSYTGTAVNGSVGHGLGVGVAPKIVIIKDRDSVNDWIFYTTVIDGSLDFLKLNTTDAKSDSGLASFSSTTFTNGTTVVPNGNQGIAYCFAEKKGFSKFGSYTGNGSTDGTFVYTGFKPAFVIIKKTDTSGNFWIMVDNKRNTYNLVDKFLYPNSSNAEATGDVLDFLSNGFKQKNTGGNTNGSGGTYIYMAFAENPIVGSNNVCATAR